MCSGQAFRLFGTTRVCCCSVAAPRCALRLHRALLHSRSGVQRSAFTDSGLREDMFVFHIPPHHTAPSAPLRAEISGRHLRLVAYSCCAPGGTALSSLCAPGAPFQAHLRQLPSHNGRVFTFGSHMSQLSQKEKELGNTVNVF